MAEVHEGLAFPIAALLEQAEHEPERVVCVAGEQEWSAARLAQESADVAAGLVSCGVESGSRVALHLENTIHAVIACLACLRVGAVVLPLNPRLTTTELSDLVERAGPVLYVGDPALYPRFADVPQALVPSERRFLVPTGEAAESDAGVRRWEELYGAARVADARMGPDAPAFLLSTSGSTGPSKLVIWSHHTLAGLSLSAGGRGIATGDVLPLITPLMHAGGLYFLLNAITQRATVVLVVRFEAGAVLDAMQARGCTSVFGLPFMCAQLARQQRARPRDLATLRRAVVAGDVCPPDVEADFQEVLGIALLSCWSSTEDAGSTNPLERPGPFMRLLPQARATVVDADGAEVPDGQSGEMLISSPTLSPGYWISPTRVQAHQGGVLHTGDLVVRLGPDVLRYVGRSKDLIVRAGSNISPAEVEHALRAHPAVLEAAVAGVADPDLGQRVGAALVLDVEQGLSVGEVLREVGRDVAAYKLPERTVVVNAVPRNALTKVDRAAVARLLDEHGSQDDHSAAQQDAEDTKS